MSEASTERVAAFIAEHGLDAEIISTPEGVPTVETAAIALGVDVDRIIKTLVFIDSQDRMVIAIACGTDRVDRRKLADAVGVSKLQLAPAAVVKNVTGYPPGGVAPIGLPEEIPVVVDERVVTQQTVYGGSGTDLHMMRIAVADVIRLNRAKIASILRSREA